MCFQEDNVSRLEVREPQLFHRLFIHWLRSSQVVEKRLTVNIKSRNTVLRSIPSSSDTVESQGVADEEVLNKAV